MIKGKSLALLNRLVVYLNLKYVGVLNGYN
jgi:hypothetical protein